MSGSEGQIIDWEPTKLLRQGFVVCATDFPAQSHASFFSTCCSL